MAKVLVIGIDGGTFDIIKPLVARGKLRNIGAIMEKGAHGHLETTMPPMTFPAWTSFMTGVNPGKHGVFDFTERIPGTYSIRFINARARMARTIWRIASDAGKRVGAISVPVTWPPEKVNGFMICGFDAPGAGGALADSNSMYPPELLSEIRREIGDFRLAADIVKEIEAGRLDRTVNIILEALERRAEIARHLYKKEEWDLFMVLFGESDQMGHFFWRYFDPGSPFHDPLASDVCKKAMETVYERIDRSIGELMEMAPPDTVVMLMSDHGFGGSGDTVLYLNRWLAENNFLKFKSAGETALENFFLKPVQWARKYGVKYIPPKIKRAIFRKKTGIANNMESWLRFSRIDWKRTVAFSEETPYYPTICLNIKGREPEGAIAEGERDSVLERITKALYEWKDPFTGESVVKKVYRREEIYIGPYTGKAADLVIDYNEPGGYSYLSRSSYTGRHRDAVRKISVKEIESARFSNKVGSHRRLGIFGAFGDRIKEGARISGAKITDVAPTILHLMGLAVPAEMDGQVIEGCLRDEFRAAPAHAKESEEVLSHVGVPVGPEETYTSGEEAEIRKRLKDLGYISED